MPEINTARVKASNDPNEAIDDATMTVNPAAGPEILMGEPLKKPTTNPPIIPAYRPDASGALEARAIPRHSGRATKKTTKDDFKSLFQV